MSERSPPRPPRREVVEAVQHRVVRALGEDVPVLGVPWVRGTAVHWALPWAEGIRGVHCAARAERADIPAEDGRAAAWGDLDVQDSRGVQAWAGVRGGVAAPVRAAEGTGIVRAERRAEEGVQSEARPVEVGRADRGPSRAVRGRRAEGNW